MSTRARWIFIGFAALLLMISVLDNELLHCDPAFGYLRITDPDFLEKIRSILEN